MNNEAVTNLNLPTKEKCDTFDIPFRVLRNASTLWRIPALLIRHTTLPDHTGEKKTVRHIQYVARLGLASRFDLTRAAVTYVSYLTLFPQPTLRSSRSLTLFRRACADRPQRAIVHRKLSARI